VSLKHLFDEYLETKHTSSAKLITTFGAD